MAVKVSVVVPVYNPGLHIDRLLASLRRQSLAPEEFEAIFVDDGSTDGTGERLDALAAEHENFAVIHIPNSGWPGRPRNVGVEAARGKYVYFVDNDDWIGDEALERLYEMAERNASDVVLGKMAGHRRPVPRELFAASRDRVTLESCPALTSPEIGVDPLTPHKLFRKAFLDEHGIRFPEGRRRLEDHVFVMNAYLHADVISILAEYVCYHWVRRLDNANASHDHLDPRGYFENGREVLDLIERHTEPGPLRDSLLRNWFEGKMLSRLGESTLLAYPADFRRELFDEIRRLALERFGPGVVEGLPAHLRVRSALLHAGDLDRLIALARVESAIEPTVELEDVRSEAGQLVLGLSGRLTYGDGTPLAFARNGERLYWDPPVDLGPEVTPSDREVTSELDRSRVDVFVRVRKERADFVLPVESRVLRHDDDSLHVSLAAEARLDPVTAAAGTPLTGGSWDVVACVRTAGWARVASVGPVPEAAGGEREEVSKALRRAAEPRAEPGRDATTKAGGPAAPAPDGSGVATRSSSGRSAVPRVAKRLRRGMRRLAARADGLDAETQEAMAALAEGRNGEPPPSRVLDQAVVTAFRALAEADLAGKRRSGVVRRAVIDHFHRLYYHSPTRTWKNTYFLGVPVWKNPLDLWLYQELLYGVRPDVLVEAGTKFGGSAYYFACLFDLLDHGQVVTIDVKPQPKRPRHPRITYVIGSSTDPAVVEEVDALIAGRRAMVVLDSAHRRDHVLEELRIWSSRVPVGSYIVVEDTHADGHPVTTHFGPGPWDAVDLFLAENDAFEVDTSRHKFFFTWNRRGYLKRVS